MSEPVKVIIRTRGGVIQSAHAGPFVQVLVIDYDDLDDDPSIASYIEEPDPWSPECETDWARAVSAVGRRR